MNNQWLELIEEYDKLSKHRTICLFQTLRSPLSRVRKHVREQWEQIIKSHKNQLSKTKDFNDLYEKLENLKIPGIGHESIVDTANRIADDYNIPIDDSCWACHCLSAPRNTDLNTLIIALEQAELTPKQKIDFILTFKTRIRRLLIHCCIA